MKTKIFLFIFVIERSNGTNNWNTFHAAAESVTMLYKGSISKNLVLKDLCSCFKKVLML